MKGRTLYYALGIPAAICCFLLLTLLFTPNEAIERVLVRAADNQGYTLDCTGFGKRFPVGLKARGLEISSTRGPILKLRDARVGLQLLPLLAGKIRFSYGCMIGGGDIAGELTLGKTPGWSVRCQGVQLEDVPFFSSVAGARVKGEMKLSGGMAVTKGVGQGDLQLEVKGAELAGVKIGEMPLPDAAYRSVRGALSIDRGRAVLKSLTLEGDGIYVRVKGDCGLTTPLGNSGLNLTMEMMPKPEFLDRQKFVFLLLTKYQSSPGAFSIPIHGTLAHPAI